jgi:hypothetical protein
MVTSGEQQDGALEAQEMQKWQEMKQEGNKLFMEGLHLKAAASYTQAIKVLIVSCVRLLQQ